MTNKESYTIDRGGVAQILKDIQNIYLCKCFILYNPLTYYLTGCHNSCVMEEKQLLLTPSVLNGARSSDLVCLVQCHKRGAKARAETWSAASKATALFTPGLV